MKLKFNSYSFELALAEIKELPNVISIGEDPGYGIFETPLFQIRVIDQKEKVEIHLGVKETFDRWANSTNFKTERGHTLGLYYPLFKPQYEWAIKVLDSKLFDFNTYIGEIDLPWFKTRQL